MKFLFSTAWLLGGLACFGLYALVGSSVAPDGRLQEPFALLPLGWALIGAGALGWLVRLLPRR